MATGARGWPADTRGPPELWLTGFRDEHLDTITVGQGQPDSAAPLDTMLTAAASAADTRPLSTPPLGKAIARRSSAVAMRLIHRSSRAACSPGAG